ncbi:MAG: WbqC family protein [Candidatus Cloacimonetes bacterium]|nr:WbqC family protein [Candidatus Cloacimonadota bacterium]
MTKIAIIQSNYIPWKGYFHIIQKADDFIFLDTAQYTQRDWRNRNRIKGPNGLIWLTVPNNGTQSLNINEVVIDNSSPWYENHFRNLVNSYRKCKHFDFYYNFLENIYLKQRWQNLSAFNKYLIKTICDFLNIQTRFHNSENFTYHGGKNERIITMVKHLGGTHYLTGPSARHYIEPELFADNLIELEYMDYSGYPEYPQPWGEFCHEVSIFDLLFCTGPEAGKYIWGNNK